MSPLFFEFENGEISMRFFKKLLDEADDSYFYKVPQSFTKDSARSLLGYGVGAALYMPAIRKQVVEEIIERKHVACTSIVLDLEDALGDLQVEEGEQQLVEHLVKLQQALQDGRVASQQIPLLFVRVRTPQQLATMIQRLGSLQQLLTGYVLPKFTMDDGDAFLKQIEQQNQLGYTLYAMPILESPRILNKETRMSELVAIRALLNRYADCILNVRIGATDFCGSLGLRRSMHDTIYDMAPLRDCIADIVNVFLRDDSPFVVSGPVWEYFGTHLAERGLIQEVKQDRLNGLVGKTVIHPTHLDAVQMMYIVSHEEYSDASRIVSQAAGERGVEKSLYGNKMNEMKPHLTWAKRILLRAEVYGVLKPELTIEQVLQKQVSE